jgi:FMN phosphatase YigB (HAD superfamily)
MDLSQIQGIIFDLDGTLYRTLSFFKLRFWFRLWQQTPLLKQVAPTQVWLRAGSFADQAALYAAFYSELAKRAHCTAQYAAVWYESRFMPVFISILRRCPVRPGLVPLLEALNKSGRLLAVLSDYGAVLERLQALQIPVRHFKALLSSMECGALKPCPLPFLKAAERLGLEPNRILYIGNRADIDGMGARAAGMHFIGIKDSRINPQSAQSDFMSWPDLRDLLLNPDRV